MYIQFYYQLNKFKIIFELFNFMIILVILINLYYQLNEAYQLNLFFSLNMFFLYMI